MTNLPITKETFVKVLNMIKEQQSIDDRVGDALEEVCGGWVIFNAENKNLAALLLLLKEVCNDVHDYIGWWLYEICEKVVYDYGEDETAEPTTYDVTTPELLYDYIEKFHNTWTVTVKEANLADGEH